VSRLLEFEQYRTIPNGMGSDGTVPNQRTSRAAPASIASLAGTSHYQSPFREFETYRAVLSGTGSDGAVLNQRTSYATAALPALLVPAITGLCRLSFTGTAPYGTIPT
jgi:hypothetical protein